MIIAGETLRELKHELRTPINHIIGYSELLIEAADDRGEPSVAEAVRPIHTGGKTLTRCIEGILPSSGAEITDGDLDKLREIFRVVLARIIQAPVLDSIAGSPAYGADLERVRSAAATLFCFANNEAFATSSGGGSASGPSNRKAATPRSLSCNS